jgi:pantoate--beta-alanine ligase
MQPLVADARGFGIVCPLSMETVTGVARLRHAIAAWRREGEVVGFVPTMGALHAGHVSLLGLARERADRVVASVFVNPTQFGPTEDFARYPRTPERDAELLREAGCDLLFLPAAEAIYPPGHATFVEPQGAALGLEGDLRPGHFRGVATVVTQLFHLVQPDLAVFGEKDAQQLAVVRQLVRDLHLPVEIVAGPTVRERDGLALSSRNAYLSPRERQAATVLHRALRAAEALVGSGERGAAAVRARMLAVLAEEPLAAVEYAAVVDADTFRPLETLAGNVVLPIAARLGRTRLIDNVRLRVAPVAAPPLPSAARLA